MDGLPAHLLGGVGGLGSLTQDQGALLNIMIMKDRVKASRLSDKQKEVHLSLINQVIEKWNTPERYDYIQRAAAAEKMYESNGLMGLAGVDQVEGLAGFWGKIGGFFKKVGKGIASGAKGLVKVADKVVTGGALTDLVGGGGGGGEQAQEQPQEQAQPQPQQSMVQRAVQSFSRPYVQQAQRVAQPMVQQYQAQQMQQAQQEPFTPTGMPQKWYQKTPVKVGIGVGGALLLGTVIYFATRKPKQQYSYQYAPVNPRYNPPQPQQLQGVGGAKKKAVKHSEKQKNATDAKVVKTIKKVELK